MTEGKHSVKTILSRPRACVDGNNKYCHTGSLLSRYPVPLMLKVKRNYVPDKNIRKRQDKDNGSPIKRFRG